MAWMCLFGERSASDLGMAGNCPLRRSGIAGGKVSPESGFIVLLRYRVHQVVSTVSFIRFVSRPICCAPVALLLGRVRNLSRLTG
jgi:hypothetical protein